MLKSLSTVGQSFEYAPDNQADAHSASLPLTSTLRVSVFRATARGAVLDDDSWHRHRPGVWTGSVPGHLSSLCRSLPTSCVRNRHVGMRIPRL